MPARMLRRVDSLRRDIASSPPLMSTSQLAWCWIGWRLGSPPDSLNAPTVARLEAAPGPGLQYRSIASLRDERVPRRRVVASPQFGHALTAYPGSGKVAPQRVARSSVIVFGLC